MKKLMKIIVAIFSLTCFSSKAYSAKFCLVDDEFNRLGNSTVEISSAICCRYAVQDDINAGRIKRFQDINLVLRAEGEIFNNGITEKVFYFYKFFKNGENDDFYYASYKQLNSSGKTRFTTILHSKETDKLELISLGSSEGEGVLVFTRCDNL